MVPKTFNLAIQILMSQANKNANRSFLQKFEGRTNKVGRSGIQSVLAPTKIDKSLQQQPLLPQNDDHLKKVDLDSLIPSNPTKISQEKIVNRRNYMSRPPLKNPQKQNYVPSTYTPQTTSKDESLSSHPPSRSMSNSTQNSRGKYTFGKYLKLDKEAFTHMQYLQSIEEKSFFKRGIRNNSLSYQ